MADEVLVRDCIDVVAGLLEEGRRITRQVLVQLESESGHVMP